MCVWVWAPKDAVNTNDLKLLWLSNYVKETLLVIKNHYNLVLNFYGLNVYTYADSVIGSRKAGKPKKQFSSTTLFEII